MAAPSFSAKRKSRAMPAFLCRRYHVSTAGRNRRAVEQHIRKQLQEDISTDQRSISEYITRSRVSR